MDVTLSAPPQVVAGSLIAAAVDVGQLAELRSADYVVTYDPAVLQPLNVSPGEVGGTTMPVDDWNVLAPGSVRVMQSLPTSTSATGTGTLAQLFFNATTAAGTTSSIAFMPAESSLTRANGEDIPTDWTGTQVGVIAGLQGPAQVAVNAPGQVRVDGIFLARLDIANVEDLNAASYPVTFDPNVLELVGILAGNAGGVVVPISRGDWNEEPAGVVSIVQTLPGLTSASGSGYLAQLRFHVVGPEGSQSEIGFGDAADQRVLGNTQVQPIPAEWAGGVVSVTRHQTAVLSVTAPDTVGAGGQFLAHIEVSEVSGLDAVNYDLTFDPQVLRLDQVTAGLIGGAVVPADVVNEVAPGHFAVVQDIPGLVGATGSGRLAELRFSAVGPAGSSSTIDLAGVVLSDTEGGNIPAESSGAQFALVDPQPPKLCTTPQPPHHDFGEVEVGSKPGWPFELRNCGDGVLDWSIASDDAWISVSPTNGTSTSLDAQTISVRVDATCLAPDLRHSGRMVITSSTNTLEGIISVTPREFPTDLTVSSITWSPQQPHDGQTVTFTAVVANQGDRDNSPAFQVGFVVNGEPIGQRFVPEGLAVGSSTDVVQTWTAKPGTSTVTAIADANNAVRESDETNNERTGTLGEIPPPDLTVTSITSTPSGKLSHGGLVTFTATVHNTGTAPTSRDFFAALLIDGGLVSSQVVRGLAVGEEAQVNLTWSARTAATSTVVADSTNVVAESDEGNNSLSLSLPEIQFANLTISEILTQPAGVQDGQPATFVATVENIGTGDVAGDFDVRFEVVGVQILGETTFTGGLASGTSTQVVSPPWTASPGSFTVRAIADSGQAIVEGEEGDNLLLRAVPVIPAPDLRVSDITQSPPNPQDGELVTLTATVANTGNGDTNRDFAVDVEVDGTKVGSSAVLGGLARGATTTVSATWTATPGTSVHDHGIG